MIKIEDVEAKSLLKSPRELSLDTSEHLLNDLLRSV